MIIVRSPLRISFFGGGTDLRDYYRNDYGCTLGHAINKYVYVIANRRFEKEIRASYLENEIVSDVKKIKHKLIREALKEFGIKSNIEIVTVGDIPGTGTGLGSSSSLAVGLSNSLSIYVNKPLTKYQIAKMACYFEIDRLKSPIGKQDQYFSTFGGFLFLRFEKDEKVKIERLNLNQNTKNELEENILAFYTGIPHKLNLTSTRKVRRINPNIKILDKIRSFAEQGRDYLRNNNLEDFSLLFDEYWKLKKSLYQNVSNTLIDKMYKKALNAGATGGKVSGAGNGGFVFFYCKPKYQQKVRMALKNFKELKFGIDNSGTIQLH